MTQKFIPLCEPYLAGNEWRYVKECLDTGWLSTAGPVVGKFEQAVARHLGVEGAVAVSSGTAGLHLALLAAGVRPGEEVVVPALSFVAPVNAVCYVGAQPVFMDASVRSWNLDVEKLAAFLDKQCEVRGEACFNQKTNRRVRAMVAVHLLGLCCDMDPLLALATQYRLQVIEDAAEAMGVQYKGKPVGTLGDIGVFSFNGNKVVTAGGGGMVVAKQKRDLEYARYLSTQAKDNPLEHVHNAIGYNYRLTSLQAAVGLAQLEQLDRFLEKKREVARYYEESFRNIEEITLMPSPDFCQPTYWLYTVLLGKNRTLQARKAIIQKLNAEGIGARPFWHPLHRLLPFERFESYQIEQADSLYVRGVGLPSSVGLKAEELARVVEGFYNALSS